MDRITVPPVALALILGTSQVAHAFQFRTRPILNSNAEADFAATDAATTVPPNSWATFDNLTAIPYGASGDLPTAIGPISAADRGGVKRLLFRSAAGSVPVLTREIAGR